MANAPATKGGIADIKTQIATALFFAVDFLAAPCLKSALISCRSRSPSRWRRPSCPPAIREKPDYGSGRDFLRQPVNPRKSLRGETGSWRREENSRASAGWRPYANSQFVTDASPPPSISPSSTRIGGNGTASRVTLANLATFPFGSQATCQAYYSVWRPATIRLTSKYGCRTE